MAALLQAQTDAQPTTPSNTEALQQMGAIQPPVITTTTNPYATQPPLTGAVDNSAILQRLAELETLVKNGFDKIAGKLSNTVISVSAIPTLVPTAVPATLTQMGGKRRKTRRSKRKQGARSK